MESNFTDANIGTVSVRQRIYAVSKGGNRDDLRHVYDDLSECYDEFTTKTYRVADRTLAEAITSKITDKSAKIMDVCAGTGLLGIQLKNNGFSEIDALDFSQGMLDIAKSKDVYRTYICDSIQKDIKTHVDDHTYDVVCMSGGMTIGHLAPNNLPELTRMAKRGGIVAFNMTEHAQTYPEYEENTMHAICQSFVADDKWVDWTKQSAPFYAAHSDSHTGENGYIYISQQWLNTLHVAISVTILCKTEFSETFSNVNVYLRDY